MAVTQSLIIGRDVHAVPTYTITTPASTDEGIVITLAASGTDSFAIPTGARQVMFTYSPGASVFVSKTAAISIPSAGNKTNSVAELNPAQRECAEGQTWNITNGTGDQHYMVIRFFKDDSVKA